jgi:hypothetical protein
MGRVDPSQRKNKSGYCHNFKTQFEGQSKTRSGSRVRLTIDLGQHKTKIVIIIVLKPNSVVDVG